MRRKNLSVYKKVKQILTFKFKIMLKNVLSIKGATQINKSEQANIKGGGVSCGSPVFSHYDDNANGGDGGAVYTQQCSRTFLGFTTATWTHSFVSDQYLG